MNRTKEKLYSLIAVEEDDLSSVHFLFYDEHKQASTQPSSQPASQAASQSVSRLDQPTNIVSQFSTSFSLFIFVCINV